MPPPESHLVNYFLAVQSPVLEIGDFWSKPEMTKNQSFVRERLKPVNIRKFISRSTPVHQQNLAIDLLSVYTSLTINFPTKQRVSMQISQAEEQVLIKSLIIYPERYTGSIRTE